MDQEERPQPELIRPLPWVFFLALLAILRVTRESISLINLMRGKPPLRSADVVSIYVEENTLFLLLKNIVHTVGYAVSFGMDSLYFITPQSCSVTLDSL